MPNKFDYAHMIVAETYAKLSSAKRLQVGAVVEKDNRIISIGYNGLLRKTIELYLLDITVLLLAGIILAKIHLKNIQRI